MNTFQPAEQLAQIIRNRQHVYQYKGGGVLVVRDRRSLSRVKLQSPSREIRRDYSISG